LESVDQPSDGDPFGRWLADPSTLRSHPTRLSRDHWIGYHQSIDRQVSLGIDRMTTGDDLTRYLSQFGW
jgi:hypothetical protein